jgi:hypothetical protein
MLACNEKLNKSMTALDAPRKPRMPVMRCPYCVEGSHFKAMIGQDGSERWYMCARCGHLTWPTNPLFNPTCAKCAELKNRAADPTKA